jgi:transcriptional regulator with XRE-family HTH domain
MKAKKIRSNVDLAGRVGVSDDAVRNWLDGVNVPWGDNLEALATALGTKVEELLPDGHEGFDELRNDLLERVLRVFALRDKGRGRTIDDIQRTGAPAPFHEMAEVSFSEPLGACGRYLVAALHGDVDEAAVRRLCGEVEARSGKVGWASLIYTGAPAAEHVRACGGPAVRVASIVELEELIDFRPPVRPSCCTSWRGTSAEGTDRSHPCSSRCRRWRRRARSTCSWRSTSPTRAWTASISKPSGTCSARAAWCSSSTATTSWR